MKYPRLGADRLDRSSTDAMHWAECLSEQMAKVSDPQGVGWLLGWFANYWAAVHGPLAKEIESLRQENAKLKADIQDMVEKAAAKHMPAYREQGEKNLALQLEVEGLKRMLGVIPKDYCPHCGDGGGVIPYMNGYAEWELEQCQWCYEREALLQESDQ